MPVSGRFLATRVWTRFVSDTPPDPGTLGTLLNAYGPGTTSRRWCGPPSARPRSAMRDRYSSASRCCGYGRVAGVGRARVEGGRGIARRRAHRPGPGAVRAAQRRRLARGTPWLTTASALARLNLARAVVNVGDVSPVTAARRTPAWPRPPPCSDCPPSPRARPPRWPRSPVTRRSSSRRARLPGKLRERMNALTRRRFLLASGAAAVAATAATVGWKDLADRTRSDPLPVGTGVLVLVTLYGGNDGLNTVIPYADPAYHSARPDLAYAPEEVLDLDDGLGLNPGLDRPQAAVGQQARWPSSAASATRSPTAATSGRWTSGRPPHPDHPARHRMDGPVAGRRRRRPPAGRVARTGAAADAGGRDPAGAALSVRGLALPSGRSRPRSRRWAGRRAGEPPLQARGALDRRPAPQVDTCRPKRRRTTKATDPRAPARRRSRRSSAWSRGASRRGCRPGCSR